MNFVKCLTIVALLACVSVKWGLCLCPTNGQGGNGSTAHTSNFTSTPPSSLGACYNVNTTQAKSCPSAASTCCHILNSTLLHSLSITNTTTSVSLTAQNISYITSKVFSGYSATLELTLTYNQLSCLPANDGFFGLTGLTFLDLSNNPLATILPGAFVGLTSLKTLYINNGSLTAITVGVFNTLHKLSLFNCYYNSIAQIAPDAFSSIATSGLTLHFSDNCLTTVEKSFLTGVTTLNSLGLNEMQSLTTVEPNAFVNLTQLQFLGLYSSGITKLVSGVFNGLGALTSLYLQNNNLKIIEPNVFCPLISMARQVPHGSGIILTNTPYSNISFKTTGCSTGCALCF